MLRAHDFVVVPYGNTSVQGRPLGGPDWDRDNADTRLLDASAAGVFDLPAEPRGIDD